VPVYDDQDQKSRTGNPGDDEFSKLIGDNFSPDEEKSMERDAYNGAAADTAERESLFNARGDDGHVGSEKSGSEDAVSNDEGLYNAGGDKKGGLRGRLNPAGLGKNLMNRFQGLSPRKKWATGAVVVAVLGGGGFSLLGLFGFLNVFKLDHLMSNIEAKAFVRYQVDMDGRSKKWIASYVRLRLGEVDDPSLAPQDRDNIYFRSDKVDTGNPATDWYRTLRATKFEQEVFEKNGVKFASLAYRDGNQIKYRPALITFKDEPVKFNLTNAEIKAIEDGNISGFNGRLSRFLDVQVLKPIRQDGRLSVRW
jgi:hypothetical protein